VFGASCDDSNVNTACVGDGFSCCPATSDAASAAGVTGICVDVTNKTQDTWTVGSGIAEVTYTNSSPTEGEGVCDKPASEDSEFGASCNDADESTKCVGDGFNCCPATSDAASAAGVTGICVDVTNKNLATWTVGSGIAEVTYTNSSSTEGDGVCD